MPLKWDTVPAPDLTPEQVDGALQRGGDIARPAVVPPKTVAAVPLPPNTARTRTNEARGEDRMQPPWCLVGCVSASGELGFDPTWAVWWDPETDRVWLRA